MKYFAKLAIAAIALSVVAAPMTAEAQSRQDRREWREDRRDHRYDRRDQRRDYRHDRRDTRADWWRGRPEFRDYRGARHGYYYAPTYGYYRVEPRYYGHRWARGHVLPPAYRTYYVRDPHLYRLRPAPRGYRWVHVNNDVVLIALATGLIAEIIYGVY